MTTNETQRIEKSLAFPRIEIFQYEAFNGTFARERSLLWNCEIVGANGRRRNCEDQMIGWRGHTCKAHAERYAKIWSEFTGWPIVDLGRAENRDDPEKRPW